VCAVPRHRDTLGSFNHFDIAAAILKPFVSDENLWMVQHHGIFQGYYFFHHIGLDREMREQFRGHAHFERTAEFCDLYDNPAFDPKGEALPISEFEPLVRRVFAQPATASTRPLVAAPVTSRSLKTSGAFHDQRRHRFTARTPLAKSWKGAFNMTHGATLGGHAVRPRSNVPASRARSSTTC